MSIRDRLLAEDCTGCLQLLMRYPPDQSVSAVVDLALALGQPGGYKPNIRTTAAAIPPSFRHGGADVTALQPTTSAASAQARARQHPSDSSPTRAGRSFAGNTSAGVAGEPGPAWLMDGGGRASRPDSGGGLPRRSSDVGAVHGGVAERRYVGGGGIGGSADWLASSGGMSRGPGEGGEDSGEMRNNWQQGLDQFTRR